ncbi:Transcriptional activator protein Pur-alpha [Manis javanica]|nr:Transcriptional activator protein Pur-alpha [Manis javanica]
MPIHLTMENLIPKSLKTLEGCIKANFSYLNFLKKNLRLRKWSSRAKSLLHTQGKTAAFPAEGEFLGLAVPC